MKYRGLIANSTCVDFIQILGEVLSNPVGLAAGFDKDGEAVDGPSNV